jgi:hypothetical protein
MRKIAQLQRDLEPSGRSELTIGLLLKRRSGGGCVARYGHRLRDLSVRRECGFRRELDYAIGILGFERFEVLPKRGDIAAEFSVELTPRSTRFFNNLVVTHRSNPQ